MMDIVERLRDPKPLPWRYIEEAADEIERLRDNLDKMRLTAETFAERAGTARDEALEEAANVAMHRGNREIAVAIRTLKEKQ